MKMKLLILSVALTLLSCSQEKQSTATTPTITKSYEYDGGWGSMTYAIAEKTIDSCEYIIIFGPDGRNIIHKANCNNTFHNQ
jgi:hypothetical protein